MRTRPRRGWGVLLASAVLVAACAPASQSGGDRGAQGDESRRNATVTDRPSSGQQEASGGKSADVPAGLARCQPATGTGGGDLPALRLACLGRGPAVDVGSIEGPALINLWASWCTPCREEMPRLQEAYERHGADVRFIGVNTRDSRGKALAFLRETGVGYEQLRDPNGRLLADVGTPGAPGHDRGRPGGQDRVAPRRRGFQRRHPGRAR